MNEVRIASELSGIAKLVRVADCGVPAYTGPVPSDNTDTNFPPKKQIVSYAKANVPAGGRILDYGAGRYARNAVGLREAGFEVYAFDPFKGGGDGWTGVTSKLPSGEKFDMVFTAFVLNVVKVNVEKGIISECRRFGSDVHWTRGADIFKMVKRAMARGRGSVYDFYISEFAPKYPGAMEELESGEISDLTLMCFCEHGVITSKGFQRIPDPNGYSRKGNPGSSSVLFFS